MDRLTLLKFERFIYFKEIDSTNLKALDLLKEAHDDVCLYTFDQTQGRGQIGRHWYTGQGDNLAVTYIWNSIKLKAKEQFYLNMTFTLAIHDFLSKYIKDHLRIKWPNDIYVGDKKIAGLLIQNILRSQNISASILGVGLNINQLHFPDHIPNPTALGTVTGEAHSLTGCLHELTLCVEERLKNLYLSTTHFKSIRVRYHSLLFRRDIISNFRIDGKVVSGIIKETTQEGKLIVELEEGPRSFNFREIEYVI